MSDGHANLFASATPANELSDTIGSNGDHPIGGGQPRGPDNTNPAHAITNERNGSTFAEENEHEQLVRHSPPHDNENNRGHGNNDESALEEESISLMDDVVESFRSEEITKLKALSNIISILDFNPSRTERAKDLAVEHYSRTLDEVEAIAIAAVKRGQHAQRGLQSSERPNRENIHSRDERSDEAIDELLSQLSQGSRGGKTIRSRPQNH
jgi:hypothetical protein